MTTSQNAIFVRPWRPTWLKCLLINFQLPLPPPPAPFLNTLSAAGPPQTSSASPVHGMLHLLSSSCGVVMSAPQKHCPEYSVPATAKPRESQKATQASLVTLGPLKLDHSGSVRGLTVSVKQPAYDQLGLEATG